MPHSIDVMAVPDQENHPASPDRTRAQPSPQCGRLLQLATAHHAGVWRFLRRLGLSEEDADDALQEAILVVARKLDRIDPAVERSFLYGTALRIAHRMWRGRARTAGDRDEVIAEVENNEPAADILMEQRQQRALLDELLRRMPEDLRTVFVLYEIEEFTMAEIAQVVGIPSGTVASRLRRARADFEQRVARIEAHRRRPHERRGDRS